MTIVSLETSLPIGRCVQSFGSLTVDERPLELHACPSFHQVGDDVAVGRKQGALVGRRGLAGTVLVYKAASALADEGAGIEDVFEMSEYMATRVGTIGAGLEHCHVRSTHHSIISRRSSS